MYMIKWVSNETYLVGGRIFDDGELLFWPSETAAKKFPSKLEALQIIFKHGWGFHAGTVEVF